VADYKQAQDKIKEYAVSFGRDPDHIQWASLMWTCLGDSKEQALKMYAAEQERRFGLSWELQPQDRHVLGSPADCIETIQQYIDLGIDNIIFYPMCSPDRILRQYEVLVKEVVPQFKDGVK
jgi:alkanesulfonate monooxygenase SsuD/methylene tetrahydromethanopterin reductase-like flavin-dependent oxidoreductase (luciferase family)